MGRLHVELQHQYVVYCKKSNIHIAPNSTFHESRKHIKIDYDFDFEKIQVGIIHLLLVGSSTQL
ncbi:hypothetical protein Lal_00018988 [Lupinus albus]|nr:hypothetical protein Lal_00018988 [Lupinus albus]